MGRHRQWPLTPKSAIQYACIDASPLQNDQRPARVIGLRVNGHLFSDYSRPIRAGDWVIVDRTRKPTKGDKVVAFLPEAYARAVGFEGPVWVLRTFRPDPGGAGVQPFYSGPTSKGMDCYITIPWDLARIWTVIGVVRYDARRFTRWDKFLKYLQAPPPSSAPRLPRGWRAYGNNISNHVVNI